MDSYGNTMEDSQNSMPDSLEASKLSPSTQRNDTQSVTKRFVSALHRQPESPRPECSDLFKTTSY